jgi:hypothetical protein
METDYGQTSGKERNSEIHNKAPPTAEIYWKGNDCGFTSSAKMRMLK